MFEETNKSIKETLKELTGLFGVSSHEESILGYINGYCKTLVDDIYTDNFGNIIANIYSDNQDAKTLMFEAHTDRVGFMVSDISDDGKIKFSALGGIDARTLPYSNVVFEHIESNSDSAHNDALRGIIMTDKKAENTDKPPKIDEMFIFTGYSKDELKDRISIGDKAIIDSGFIELMGNSVCSGAMDNRAGVTAVLYALKKIDRTKLKYNIKILFSSEEELGLHGGYTGTLDTTADAAIVVDVTHGMTPDSKDTVGVFKLGCGAVICRGPNLSFKHTKKLIKLADKQDIPYEIEVAPTHSGTTAWAIQMSGGGTPVMLVSVADKYMHTNVETISIDDVESVSKLLCAAAEEGVGIE